MIGRNPCFLLALLALTLTACIKSEFRRAEVSDDPRVYHQFIDRHPEGPYADRARTELERWRAFEAAREKNTPAAYRKFLEKYPDGETANRARRAAQAFELLEKAFTASRNGDKEEARKLFDAAVAADPSNAEILAIAGLEDLKEGRRGEACARLTEAVRLKPDDYRTRILLVMALLQAGRTAEGIEEARAVLESRPEDVSIRKTLGSIFMASGLYELAAVVLSEAMQLSGSDPEVVLLASQAALRSGDPAEAMELLKRVPENDPLFQEVLFLRGECYLALGDNLSAHREFEKYISIKPEDIAGYSRDGMALERLGRRGEAIERYKRADKLVPRNSAILWRWAVTAMIDGRHSDAREKFESYLGIISKGWRAEMARRAVAGESPGYEDIPWGADVSTATRIKPSLKRAKASRAGDVKLLCADESKVIGGFSGKTCFEFKAGKFSEARFESNAGALNDIEKIDPLIRELKNRYGAPLSSKPRVNNIITDDGTMTSSEIAWGTPDGIVVLRIICVNDEVGFSRCDLRISWGPG